MLLRFKSYEISGKIVGLIWSFLSNRRLWIVLDGKSLQGYRFNANVPQSSILGSILFPLCINDLDDVTSNIAIFANDTRPTVIVIRHLICDNNESWLLHLNMTYETLWTSVESGFLISMLEKVSLFCLTGLITLMFLTWKWMGLFSKKNHFLRCWDCLSLLNWIGSLTLSVLLKLPPIKSKPWFVLWSFFTLRVLSALFL